MRPAASGDIGALVESYDADPLLRPVPHSDFVGRLEGNGGAFRLVPRVGGTAGFDLTPSANGSELTGKSATCGTFTLRRVSPASPSRRSSVAIPSNGGAYRSGDALQSRCQALLGWAGHLSREFPDLNMRSTPMTRLMGKGALLYADDDFIPVFGFPYDEAAAVESGSSPGRQTILSPPGDGARTGRRRTGHVCQGQVGAPKAALPEAEAALQKVVFASPVGKYDGRQLLASYLSWEGDARLPEATEYERLADRFGIASPLR
jgi:hypothetical protein